MTAQFTEKQLDNFRRYVRIWKSHTFNMFDPRARLMTSMDRDEWVFCMDNYSELEAATEETTP